MMLNTKKCGASFCFVNVTNTLLSRKKSAPTIGNNRQILQPMRNLMAISLQSLRLNTSTAVWCVSALSAASNSMKSQFIGLLLPFKIAQRSWRAPHRTVGLVPSCFLGDLGCFEAGEETVTKETGRRECRVMKVVGSGLCGGWGLETKSHTSFIIAYHIHYPPHAGAHEYFLSLFHMQK